MSLQNPYIKLYYQTFPHKQKNLTKQYCKNLVVNFAQAHNALGQMIKDIINVMGNFTFDKNYNKNNRTQNQPNIDFNNKYKPKNNNQVNNNKQTAKQIFQNNNKPQKMEVQYDTLYASSKDEKQPEPKQSKFDLFQFQFQSKQKPKQLNKKPFENDIYKQLFRFNSSKSLNINSSKQNLDDLQSNTSHTQTAQIVRSDQNQRNQANSQVFDNINQFEKQKKQESNPFKVKVKPFKQQKQGRKQKSPFYDLYDSQTPSYSQPQQFLEVLPQKQQSKFEPKHYSQTQINQNCQTFLNKNEKILYSPQIKKNIEQKNKMKNLFIKKNNLLEETFWNNSPQKKMFNVEQIDEIQTSEKKIYQKTLTKKKSPQNLRLPDSDQEYIPRREQKGRKKIDREGMKGSQCPDCKAFYQAVSEDSKNFKDMCECTSRHKSTGGRFINNQKVNKFSQEFNL